MLIALHMYAEIALSCGGILAHVAPVGLVAAVVGLPSGQLWMRSILQAVHTADLRLTVLLFHVDLQCFMIFVVPIALGALQGLIGVSIGNRWVHQGGVLTRQYLFGSVSQVAVNTVHSKWFTVGVLRTAKR